MSDDGQNFRKVCNLAVRDTTTFDEVTARYFRLWLPVMPPRGTELAFTAISFSGARLDKADAQTGMAADRSVNQFAAAPFPAANIIPASAIVDLTGRRCV